MPRDDVLRLDLKTLHNKKLFSSTNGRMFLAKEEPYKTMITRLLCVMRSVVMRHKKDQLFNGRPIVTMPAKEERTVLIDFTATQRANYEKLYAIAKERYLYYETIKNVGRGYIDILSSLHPARQACSGYECSAAHIEQQLADAQARA